jgi:hypothetical protein
MLKENNKNFMVAILVFLLLSLLSMSAVRVFASGGTIAAVNFYPVDGETYEFIDHFIYQTTAVNTNTTVSISLDDEPPIPLVCEGLRNEQILDDAATQAWYTWQLDVPAISTPGEHTFQVFSHYYVWQNEDEYWAEYNSYSTVKSFTIYDPLSNSSEETQPTDMTEFQIVFAIVVLSLVTFASFSLSSEKSHSDKKERPKNISKNHLPIEAY